MTATEKQNIAHEFSDDIVELSTDLRLIFDRIILQIDDIETRHQLECICRKHSVRVDEVLNDMHQEVKQVVGRQ